MPLSAGTQRSKPLKILQASAGSGKTFSLTAHYLTLLFKSDYKYREILAVTFTNKAMAEMKGRILEVLHALATGNGTADVFGAIIRQAHPHLTPQSLQEKARQTYRRILHDYSRFSVTTIDGFVQQVIRSFAFELGLDAGYRLELKTDKVKHDLANRLDKLLEQDEQLLEWIINLALDRIRNDKSWNYRSTLLDLASELFKERYYPFEQALALHQPGQLFTDLHTVTEQIISFFETTLQPKASAAWQIFQQSGVVQDELKGKSTSPIKFLENISSGDFSKTDYVKKLINNPDEWQKGSLSAPVQALYDTLNPALSDLHQFYTAESPQYAMAKAIEANLYYLRLMHEMGGLLKDYRQENQVLLISDAQNLLRGITSGQGDNPSFIWEKMGNRYRHFLFDEFQDTSAFQWENFLPLLRNAIAEASGEHSDNLIVGDVKQSIYRWRNGDWRILLQQARRDVGDVNVADDSLAENYRSAANIIDFNNFLFAEIPQILQEQINLKVAAAAGEEFFNGWWKTQGYTNIIQQAYINSHQQKAPKTLAGGSIDVKFLPAQNSRSRANDVKETALTELADTLDNWIGSGRYTAGQICVLVRSNTEAREVIGRLMQNNSGYDVLSGEALLVANNTAVKLLISTLRLMVTKRDESALLKATCIQLYHQISQKNAPADILLKLNQLAPEQLGGYLPDELCNNFTAWQQFPMAALTEKLIGAYGLNQLVLHLPYLFTFRDMVSHFNTQGERGIARFLDWWDEEGEATSLPATEHAAAVQVMTIHKSKGLAFDVVMLPFCSWGLDGKANSIFWVNTAGTPYAMLNSAPVNYVSGLGKSLFSKAYFEELLFNYMDALNMLYVAATRTRQHLYITAPAVAKTEGSISLAGDLIFYALKKSIAGLPDNFDGETFTVDDGGPLNLPENAADTGLVFDSYPLTSRLEDVLISKKVWEQHDLLSGNPAQRRGLLMHDLLSRISGSAELGHVLAQMQQEGLLRSAEAAAIKNLAESVLDHPELKQLLARPYQSFNEQTIINSKGQSYRPDKVLVGEDDLVLIDFKFTGEPRQEHRLQVNEYRDLLFEMGYKNIQAYLYYGYLQELIKV